MIVNMKKIISILASFSAVVAISGCSNDFINLDKPYSLTETMVFSDPDYIEANLRGCYGIFKSSYPTFMGGLGFVVFDSRGDDIVNVSNPVTMQDTYEMRVLGTADENTRIWDYAYYTINYSNLFADKLVANECESLLGAQKYNQFIAEARFLRAYSYYVLCQLYSEPYCKNPNARAVPLRLVGLESSGNNSCPAATIEEVYKQILADCIPDALPDTPGTEEGISRASKAAAHLLRMRVYMAMQDWENAIKEGEAISGYQLASDVTSLYGDGDVYSSKEMIFALPSSIQDKPNTQMSCAEFFDIHAGVCWLDTESGILSKNGYFLPEDQRINKLVTDPDSDGYVYTKKFVNYGSHLDWVPLMRYAEVQLNLAECYASVSNGTDNARKALKAVRSRSIAAADDVIAIDDLSGDALKTAVYNERRLEFICEGMRGIDILRRGETFVKTNKFVNISVAPGANGYVWPIPDEEYTYNKELKK